MNRIVLEVEDLDLWRGDAWLVRGLDLRVEPGTLVHVTGPNGSGKTTLLRALGGLTRPESGAIHVNGRPIESDLSGFHSQLAWLGHRDGLKPELSVRENLRAYARLAGPAGMPAEADLAAAGIGAVGDLQTRLLSAGQRRRAAIARVFATAAPLWILDEPLANLDADGCNWALERLQAQVDRGGIVILTSHLPFDTAAVTTVELGRQ